MLAERLRCAFSAGHREYRAAKNGMLRLSPMVVPRPIVGSALGAIGQCSKTMLCHCVTQAYRCATSSYAADGRWRVEYIPSIITISARSRP
jgi:hypothetical protein